MVTHDSRKNEHCAVEKKKKEYIKRISKLWKTREKLIIIIVSVVHIFLHGNGRRQGILFTPAYTSLKSKPADSARGLAVSNMRERQRVQKQSFFSISPGTT